MSSLNELLQQIETQIAELEASNALLNTQNAELNNELTTLNSNAISEVVLNVDARLLNLENLIGPSSALDSVKSSWDVLKSSL